ncbi:MAG: efflux RND transporter periplasmic adaptor subunit [Patescibacteria group bacterium]|jgi:HlyD family secretion protein
MNFIKKLLKKKIILLLIAIVILVAGYFGYKVIKPSTPQTSYVTAAVAKGTIVTSISGTGQVSSSNQIDITPKVSGDITSVKVTAGQEIKSGDIIAQINAAEAQKTVRDAKISLESTKISLEKLKKPTDALSLLQAENAITQAEQTKQNAEDSLVKAYDNAFTSISNAFLDLPTVITGLHDVIYGNDYKSDQENIYYYADLLKNYDENVFTYRQKAIDNYLAARSAYDKNFSDYQTISRYSDSATIESLLNQTYTTTKSISQAIKSMDNFLGFVKDQLQEKNQPLPSQLAAHQSSLSTYTGNANSNLSDLLSNVNAIKSDKDTISNSDFTIKEKTQSLADLRAGTDPLDLQSAELSVRQKQIALADAQTKLADYTIRAPFDGVVAAVNVEKSDSASSGTAIVTLVTKQKIAEISLNEVDAAKVKTGQKVILTFDAVADLKITGQVAAVDTLGTVSSGVVSYNVKITFDVQDDRVKPGMSLSANIITDSKQDILVVPLSAVKTGGDSSSYVQVLINNQPEQKTVTTGLSNDTMIEITSGLAEGDQIITQTISGASAKTNSASSQTNTNRSNNSSFRGLMQLGGEAGGPSR